MSDQIVFHLLTSINSLAIFVYLTTITEYQVTELRSGDDH